MTEGVVRTTEKTVRLIAMLSPLTGPSAVGGLFGDGSGLEMARAVSRSLFDSADEMRSASFQLAVTLLSEESLGEQDAVAVMGLNGPDPDDLTADQAAVSRELGGATMAFLGQFNQDGMGMWELWKRSESAAEEFMCWCAVFWGRLETVGRVRRISGQ